MKLITLLTLVTTCWANELNLSQLNRPQYSFPLQFHESQANQMVTKNNVYLPPDAHTAIPYISQKNSNHLQYHYLPPTETKAPNQYPPQFPMFSSTFRPNSDDDDEDEEEEDDRDVFVSSTVTPFDNTFNQSRNSPGPQIEIPNRPIPKAFPYFEQIDRIDAKYPAPNSHNPVSPTSSPFFRAQPGNRRMVQQPAGFMASQNHNDQMVPDQMKTASFPGHQYVPPPPGYLGPTPEPVPILRLSNEMDLDGSYSYEALSADQTHVMQHGHVENVGTDHAENVVEGSYSYVGDNGQTYTVHYIADGNGFRASGDHLPVPPPVPEIIQRSIEYNMAEESSKPLHLRGDGSYNHEDNKSNNVQVRPHPHYFQPPMQQSSPRNMFPTKQPEAFSHNHNGPTSTQSNNLHSAASTQTPVVHYEAPKEQPSRAINNAPITPQITFLASQGAHDPSQSISRMYSPPAEPVFRFGNLKNKFEQSKPERASLWPYTNPFSHDSVTKIPPAKNFISRSSVDPSDDDVMINFSDMTPEQYSRMYNSQINPRDDIYDDYDAKKMNHISHKSNNDMAHTRPQYEEDAKLPKEYPANVYGNQDIPNMHKNYNMQPVQFPFPQDWYNNINKGYNPSFQSQTIDYNNQRSQLINMDSSYVHQNKEYVPNTKDSKIDTIEYSSSANMEKVSNVNQNEAFNPNFKSRSIDTQRSSLITKKDFIPPSRTVTSSYDYQNDNHEARQIQFNANQTGVPEHYQFNTSATPKNYDDDNVNDQYNTTHYEIFKSNSPQPVQVLATYSKPDQTYKYISESLITPQSNIEKIESIPNYTEDSSTSYNTYKVSEENSARFEPIDSKNNENGTTPQENMNNALETNIFLKSLLKNKNENPENSPANHNNNWKPSVQFINKVEDKKEKKEVKMYHPKTMTANEFEDSQKKPIDISQIANLVTLKNYFESNKIKPKQKYNSNSGSFRTSYENNSLKNHQDNQPIHSNENRIKNTDKESKPSSSFKKENFNTNTNTVTKSVDMDRIIGVAKIYKTLQRNSRLEGYGPPQLRTELRPPVHDLKIVHKNQGGLPPLGRAGPSMKSYLPPLFNN